MLSHLARIVESNESQKLELEMKTEQAIFLKAHCYLIFVVS